jgi:tetratricopeptide (TPR) repeat protein
MSNPRPYLAWLFMVATVLKVSSLPVLADSSCSGLGASATLSSTLSLPPASSAPFAEIRAAIAQGLFERAEELLGKAPPGAELLLWRGILLLHTGKTFASIRSLEEASRLHDSSTIETLLGVDYFLLNQRLLAEQAISKALALYPGNKRGRYLRGRFYFAKHDFSKAMEDFRAVLEKEPDDYRSLCYLGYSEWRLGKTDEAARHLQRSVDVVQCLHINFLLALQTLAQLEFQNGDLNHALAHSDMALSMAAQSKDPEDNFDGASDVLLVRGKIHLALGKQQEAIEDWRRALQLNPALVECWYLLAHLYRQRGETNLADDALTHFKTIHEEL